MNTKQKTAIKKFLKNTVSHPTAERIYQQVKKDIPGIALGTIYRNLKLMKENGEVTEIITASRKARYDGKTDEHYHFTCDKCGQIIDLDETIDSKIQTIIAKNTGLKVTHLNLEFNGLCKDCQKTGTRE
jgi:Fur family transcriptional regulator, peroxide stress response regulator